MFKYILKKTASWLLVIFLATNIAYFLAATFLDPRSNYIGRNPPLRPEEISNILQPLGLDPETPLLERWWNWFSGILFHWDWGSSLWETQSAPRSATVRSCLPSFSS